MLKVPLYLTLNNIDVEIDSRRGEVGNKIGGL